MRPETGRLEQMVCVLTMGKFSLSTLKEEERAATVSVMVAMADGDNFAVVADDGVDAQPGFDEF